MNEAGMLVQGAQAHQGPRAVAIMAPTSGEQGDQSRQEDK